MYGKVLNKVCLKNYYYYHYYYYRVNYNRAIKGDTKDSTEGNDVCYTNTNKKKNYKLLQSTAF